MAEDIRGTPAGTGGGSRTNELALGQRVGMGRYTLVRQLGQGGMGVVWLAQDEQLGEAVALKFLAREIIHDTEALQDLRRETLKSRKLTHPNIVRIHDLHQVPGEVPFISLEYVDGQSLGKFKAEQPQRCFAWDYLKPLVKQLCEALDYAHGEHVIHRDLKPANLMLDGKGRLKLADFGLAAVVSDSLSRISLQHSTSGTPAYMSPQQMDGRPPHVTDDVYALGATLYELLASKPPFYQGNIVHQVKNVAPDPLVQRQAEFQIGNPVPPEVEGLIMACLAKDPQQRPQSAKAVADWIGLTVGLQPKGQHLAGAIPDGLRAGRERKDGVAEEAGEAEEVLVAAGGTRRGLWIGLVLAALALVAVIGWLVFQQNTPARSTAQGKSSLKEVIAPSAKGQIKPMNSETATGASSRASAPIIPEVQTLSEGFVSLFNGRDLAGWSPREIGSAGQGIGRSYRPMTGGWSARSGELVCVTNCGSYLRSDGQYGDFVLQLQFKLPPNGHSGIFIRCSESGNISAQTGMKIPILDPASYAGKMPRSPTYRTGGIPPLTPAALAPLRPIGQWNSMEIRCEGEEIEVSVNGTRTISANMGREDKLRRRPRSGHIGIANWEGEANGVAFRNLRLKPLNAGAARVDLPPAPTAGISGGNAPANMVLIPAGPFQMGDPFGEGDTNELPLHVVQVSAFYMDKHEVTKALWDDIHQWATNHGYSFDSRGDGSAANHPVVNVNWYDAVKWCNARSEKEGRVPAYYAEAGQRNTYRTGRTDLHPDWVKWEAGYRLPTEAEWEKAARGGVSGKRFPWGDTISHSQANYKSNDKSNYDVDSTRGSRPTDAAAQTGPVGTFAANSYGLFDMAGNVREWCWDRFEGGYYVMSPSSNPRGPLSSPLRVQRGGGCFSGAYNCRTAVRFKGGKPTNIGADYGFRAVLPAGQP